MRRVLASVVAGLLVTSACMQDFDQFSIGEAGGGAGEDGAAAAGGSAGGGASGGAGGTAGDASVDAPIDGEPPDGGPDGGCPSGTKSCAGTCVPDNNPATGCAEASCSACAFANATAACDAAGLCAVDQCNGGFSDCNGNASDGCEAQPDSDPNNCGSCGNACVIPNATASCTAGVCGTGTCDAGYDDCSADPGCETKVDSDPKNCGSCGNDCTAQPGTWTCQAGVCTISNCPSGKAECDGNPGTVCEADLSSDPANCGVCGNSCNSLANATGQCVNGACAIQACDPGFDDCDTLPGNGCEVDLSKNVGHCGKCNRPCSSANAGTVTCNAGLCTSSCSPGYGNCSQPAQPAADDGCEVNLLTDPSHCGSCPRACSTANVSQPVCSAGKCESTCNTGYGNCGAPLAPAPDDGCETNIGSDPTNCGACARLCSNVNVQAAACSGGVCTSSCTSGWGNCTTPGAPAPDNGCETHLSADVDNCGACNRVCSGTNVAVKSCNGGTCNSTCNAGFSNCSLPVQPAADNGCETNINADPANCGGCGRACSTANVATSSCTAGLCTSSCTPGHGNCTTPAAPSADDGCETTTATDTANCGACGRACSTTGVQTLACAGGLCTSSCTAGLGNCSQPAGPLADDGCETSTTANVAHCGGCNRACSTANVSTLSCSAGKCNSYCDLGFGNCNQANAPTADDGCELDVKNADATCGSCTNSCVAQNGMVCGDGSIADNRCGCNSDGDCQTSGDSGSCNSSGVCVCPGPFGSDTCRPGEVCVKPGIGSDHDCSCNGGGACSSSEVCCQSPSGCVNLSTNAANCGACGRACPPGFACSGGNCACQSAANCNAGSAGTCSSGLCVCGTTTCAAGERCLAGGTCG